MVHGIRSVSGSIVVIVVVGIMNHHGITMITITTMVIIVIMMIDPDSHYGKRCKVGRIVAIMIRRVVGHIHG
jgi:hypothetical protein